MAIRLVPPSVPPEPDPVDMTEALTALFEIVARANPTLVMVVFESPVGKLNIRTLPVSPYIAEILAKRAATMMKNIVAGDGI